MERRSRYGVQTAVAVCLLVSILAGPGSAPAQAQPCDSVLLGGQWAYDPGIPINLTVSYISELPFMRGAVLYKRELAEAIEGWSRREVFDPELGREVFMRHAISLRYVNGNKGQIRLFDKSWSDPDGLHGIARTTYSPSSSGPIYGRVWIELNHSQMQHSSFLQRVKVISHELGHALGLGEDNLRHCNAARTIMEQRDVPFHGPTPWDIVKLNSKYPF
jgi:hypothetical protein